MAKTRVDHKTSGLELGDNVENVWQCQSLFLFVTVMKEQKIIPDIQIIQVTRCYQIDQRKASLTFFVQVISDFVSLNSTFKYLDADIKCF